MIYFSNCDVGHEFGSGNVTTSACLGLDLWTQPSACETNALTVPTLRLFELVNTNICIKCKNLIFFFKIHFIGVPFLWSKHRKRYKLPVTLDYKDVRSWQDYITKGPRHPLLLRFITMTQHLCVYIVFAHAIKLQMLQIDNIRVWTVCIRPSGTTCRN